LLKKSFVLLAVISLLKTTITFSAPVKNVELFDIQKDTVTETVPHNSKIQKAATEYLNGINQNYVKVNPIPKSGYMVRIPLEPPIQVKNKWINELVDEVIIILTKEDQPYLMIFDDENNPHFFYFKGNTETLSQTFNTLTH
jgi:hypothetical protein